MVNTVLKNGWIFHGELLVMVAHVLIHSQVPQRLAVYLLKCFFLLVAGSMLPWPLKRYYFIASLLLYIYCFSVYNIVFVGVCPIYGQSKFTILQHVHIFYNSIFEPLSNL